MSYRHISLPRELVDRIEKLVKEGRYGYRTVTEFVKDAVRRRLEELEKR